MKGLEKEEGTKTLMLLVQKPPNFMRYVNSSSRTAELKGIANVLYKACNFKHHVNNVSITFSIAA